MTSRRAVATGDEPQVGARTMADTLAVHLDGRDASPAGHDLSDEERAELRSLLILADRLDARMRPLVPSPAFVDSLGAELVRESERRMAEREKRHRMAVTGAAVAGGVLSIASLVGGVVMLLKWLRTRTDARQPSTA